MLSSQEPKKPKDQSETIDIVVELLRTAKSNYDAGRFSDYNQNIFTAVKGLGFITEELIADVRSQSS